MAYTDAVRAGEERVSRKARLDVIEEEGSVAYYRRSKMKATSYHEYTAPGREGHSFCHCHLILDTMPIVE